ncbi:MAG: helix-turn-helix domain-containing protein [Treponema sp.]|nr:helix-turn-helix domain-containing protein [Treponema sp.]
MCLSLPCCKYTLNIVEKQGETWRRRHPCWRECGTGTIGGIEAGKAKPSFDMMIKIAEALKINPADFFLFPPQ